MFFEDDNPTIGLSRFFLETTPPEGFAESYTNETLLQQVQVGCITGRAIPGYRDGVLLVSIPVRDMKTKVIETTPDTQLNTTYESRVPGEAPRVKTVAIVDYLPPAVTASVVLYRADVLAEDNDRSTDCDWEVVTILTHAGSGPEPMTPGTLMANHFKADGGTATNMTPEQFEAALRESYNFWKCHCMAELAEWSQASAK
jgi:hypothetical protein